MLKPKNKTCLPWKILGLILCPLQLIASLQPVSLTADPIAQSYTSRSHLPRDTWWPSPSMCVLLVCNPSSRTVYSHTVVSPVLSHWICVCPFLYTLIFTPRKMRKQITQSTANSRTGKPSRRCLSIWWVCVFLQCNPFRNAPHIFWNSFSPAGHIVSTVNCLHMDNI